MIFVKHNNSKSGIVLLFVKISALTLTSLQAEKNALLEYVIANYSFYLNRLDFGH